MKNGFMLGLLTVTMALSMSFSGVARADENSLPPCNENSLWSLADETIPDEFGITVLHYQCMPEGWALIGVEYCTYEGDCSSN